MNIESRIDKLFELRELIKDLNDQKSALQSDYDNEEYRLIEDMEAAGLSRGGTDRGTVSIKVDAYPQVSDMEAFVDWAATNGRADMIQKRVSSAVFREFVENTNEMPDGVDTYEKTVVSLRRK